MGVWKQLRLLLWKDFLVRRRNLGVLGLTVGWAVGVFLVLYIVRESIVPQQIPSCQFKARALPSAGLFPFLQSFVCNIDNKCENLSSYEEVPKYQNAKLTNVLHKLQDAFTDEDVLDIARNIPKMLSLLKTVYTGIESTHLEGLFGRGVPVFELMNDPPQVKSLLRDANPDLDENVVDDLFNASFKFGPIIDSVGTTNFSASVCNATQLKRYLLVKNETNLERISTGLCKMNTSAIPKLIENLLTRADFEKFMKKLQEIVNHFTTYNVFEDVAKLVDVILHLESVQQYLPKEVRLPEWLPKVLPLLNTMNKTRIDKQFVVRALNIIEPYFNKTYDWPAIRRTILTDIDTFAILQKHIVDGNASNVHMENFTTSIINNFYTTVYRLSRQSNRTDLQLKLAENTPIVVQYILNQTFSIFNSFDINSNETVAKITNMADISAALHDPFQALHYFILLQIYDANIVSIYHELRNRFDVEEITYDVCKRHNETLAPLVDLGPDFVNNLFTCFANIRCMNVFVMNKENISDFFCNEENWNEQLKDFNLTSVNGSVLCGTNLTTFVDDLSTALYLNYSMNYSNLDMANMSTVVNRTKHLLNYIDEKSQDDTNPTYDWTELFPTTVQSEWSNVTSRIQSQRNLYIINAQLAYFRFHYEITGRMLVNVNYLTRIMKAFLQEYKLIPNLMLRQTIANFPVIVESALRTLTNKSQILELTQTSDWVKYLCEEAKEEHDALKQLGCDIITHLLGRQRMFPPLVPILEAIRSADRSKPSVTEKDLQDFEITAQEFFLTMDEIYSYKLPVYNWSEMEVLKPTYWINWLKTLTIDNEIRFGIRIVANFVDLIDKYSTNTTKDIKTAKAVSANINQYIIFVNDLIDMAINANKTNVQSYYPLTFNVSRTIASNLSFLVEDFNSYMDKDLSNVFHLKRLFNMSCDEDALQVFKDFRSETKSVIAALRDVVCNTTKYINEWQFDYEIKQNVVDYDAAKDWQYAVTKFGALARQISRNSRRDDGLVQHWSNLTKELELVHQGYDFERLLFAMVDTQLNTPESGYKSMAALWKSYNKQCTWNNKTSACTSLRTDVAKYTAKLVATAIGETVTRVRSYLRTINSTEQGVSPLALLGFSNSSAVHMMYTKLPDIITMFVNSYRRPEFEAQILNKVTQGQSAACTDVMSWMSVPANSSLSTDDMRSITRYLCPSIFDWPLIEDNYLLSIVLKLERLATSTPVAKFDKTYVSALNDILLLKDDLLSVSQYGQLNLTVLWTKPWLDNMRATFRQLQQLEFTPETSITRLFPYMQQRESRLWLYPKRFLSAKYGFGEFSLVVRLMTRFLEKLSETNWADTDMDTREQAEALLDLFEFYPKQVSGILAFVYFRTSHGSDFWYTLQDIFCQHGNVSQTMKTYIPAWMLQDEDEILTKICQLNATHFDDLYYDPDFKNVTQFNVPLENVVIDFISSILNITDDQNFTFKTIVLRDMLSENFLNGVFPSEDQSRNSSIMKAEALVENIRVYKVMILVEQLQILTTYVKMLEGGDWWKTLMSGKLQPPLKMLLHMIENIPLYPLHAIQTATVPNLPYRIASEVLRNPRFPCRSLLDLSDFLEEDNLLLLMQQVCNSQHHTPDVIIEEYILNEQNETEYSWRINETVLADTIYLYERELVTLLRDGIKRPSLPAWLNGTLIADRYSSFGKRMKQPLVLLQTVTAAMTDVLDVASLFYKNHTECPWCSGATVLVRTINQQLALTPSYIDLMCRMPNMTYDQVKQTLLTDFRWERVLKKLKEKYSYTIDDFNEEIHSSVDVIRSQIIAFYTNKTLQTLPAECFHNLTRSPAARNLSTYVSIASELLRGAKFITLHYLNTTKLGSIAKKLEGNLTTTIPIRSLIDSYFLQMVLKNIGFNQYEINRYLNSSVNVTKLSEVKSEKELENLLSNPETSSSVISYYAGPSKDYHQLALMLYRQKMKDDFNNKVLEWRRNQKGPLDNVVKIFESMEDVLMKSDDLFEFLGTIDFNAITNGTFNPSSVLQGVADLLRHNSLEKLFDSFRDLIKQLSNVIHNKQIEHELYTVVDGVEGLNIFRNLRLLTLKYNISDLTSSWTNASDFLIKELQLKPDVAEALLNSSLDMLEIFATQKGLTNIKTYLCNSNELQTLFYFNDDSPDEIAHTVSESLCNLNNKQLQELAVLLLKNINFSNLLTQVMNSTAQNVLNNANLSEEEGRNVMKSLGKATSYIPTVRSVATIISDDLSTVPHFQKLQAQNFTKSLAVSPDVMSSATTLLCGRPLIQRHAKIYKTIAEAKDFSSSIYNEAEEMTLPTEFCRNTYRNILQLNAGKVIWSYMKPLIRGKILYTPDIPITRQIMESTNFTFSRIGDYQDVLLQSITQMQDIDLVSSLNKIKEFMNSFIVQAAIEQVMQMNNITFDLSKMNVTKLLNEFGNAQGLKNSLNLSKDILQCVLLNRFVPMEDETALEREAKKLMEHNEFIAGVVFVDLPTRSKRDTQLPHNITYKIRMDIDSVPTTSATKYQFWTPGPDADFLDDMRYFRGFIQLQDMLDNAIIGMHANRQGTVLPRWQTLTQQMPYPCWTKDFFKAALSVAQGLQVCFFFGFIVLVAASVRYVVWEKESGNTMVMNVMGLKYLTHCASWFIVTCVEMLIVVLCAFVILMFGNILPTTSPSLLLLYMLDYGFSVVMFCYMVSSMFDSASLGSVGSAIFFLLSFMPYIIIIALETTLSLWLELFVNLSMSTSFCYGCLYIIRYETQGVGLGWDNAWSTPLPGDNMNFGMTCVFIAFDGILYGIIGYICSRSSQELRALLKRLPFGCFSNRYQLLSDETTYVTFDTELYGAGLTGDNYLDATISSTNVVNDEPLKIGVTIKSLTKVYNTRKKSVKAIDNIDITLYTGQVTSLLGHNGAGKTTLIKILTGMMRPTAGQIIINSEITRPNDKACRYLGVCSQSSVLIDTMSAREHLIFYAKLKTSGEYVDIVGHVLHMVESLGLGALVDEPVAHLSEGMRRRLCVAIAFIGQPKLVVLDEPSSGVDPVARRQIWDLVVRHKEGCTVLLTTHYLDEAELLSDRVVVLHKGKVLCSGSPLALKNNYGSGYKLLVTYPSLGKNYEVGESEVKALTAAVHKWAPNASLTDTDGCSVTLTVPFLSNSGTANNYEQLALELEQNQTQLGYATFTMNCATLEQVFLKLCAKADQEAEDTAKTNSATNGVIDDEQQPRNHFVAPSRTSVYSAASVDELYNSKEDIELIKTGATLTGSLGSKLWALLKKRAIHYVLDWRVVVCAIVLPTIFTAVAMGFSLIRPPNTTEPALALTPDLYQPQTTSFISIETHRLDSFPNQVSQKLLTLAWRNHELEEYNKRSRHCRCEDGKQKCDAPSTPPTSNVLLKLTSSNETLDWLLETHNEYIERRYGGWSLTETTSNMSNLVVWYNNKGYHAMPAYLSTLNNAILQSVAPGATISASSHPLKLSVEQLSKSTVAQHVADVGIAMVLLVAFSLVPASGAIYLVQERVSEEKRLQLLCGVSPTLYWSVAFLWDMIVLAMSLLAAIIVFNIFGLPVYVARENMAAVSLLILLYGWACVPFVHLMQRFFHDASMANMILFCSCAFIGIMELTCLLLMDILGTTQFVEDLRYVLHKIYLIFPQFVLGDGLVEISKNNIQSDILKRFHMDTYVSPLSWELMGLHYLCLFIVGVVLFTINLLIENNVLRKPKQKSVCYPSDTCCLETINLCKEYNTVSGKMSAVKNLSLQVPFGQCIGLIGVNGAGKSTTFKMLTTEIAPSKGHIFLLGKPIGHKPLSTGEMGYCPQCDALDPKLTVLQTIKFYLKLRGIPNQYEYAHKLLSQFELMSYANRRCENLSGGNKRKLCTALSILGRTSLVLMDEPTSGMDPYSRSLVAHTIQQMTKQNRSVVLTSHSVEDCENLCSHVIVMINGRIACQGSPQDLKERFGSGYIVSVRLAKPSDQDALLEQIQTHFPGAQLISRQYCSSQFSLSTDHTLVSQMFSRMAKISDCIAVEDFSLVQCSLDQVFINFTNKSQEMESTNIKSTLPDMYTMTVL